MARTTILLNRSDYLRDLKELKTDWIDSILMDLDVDLDFIKEGEIDDVQEYLFDNNIEIINYLDIDGVRIDKDGETIAEWAGPEFVMKKDEEGLLYYEVTIENWSIFE